MLARFTILSTSQREGEGPVAAIRLHHVARGGARRLATDLVRLHLPASGPEVRPGDRLLAWLVLRRRVPFANEGEPPRRLVPGLSGRLKSAALVEAHHRDRWHPRRALDDIRRYLLARLDDGLARGGASARARALAAAVILGERERVDPDDHRRLVDGGAAHVLAVSGLHMTAVIGLLGAALQRLGLGPRRAALVVLLGIPAYALLLPLRPSVVRAALMGLCLPAARLLGRGAEPLNLLGGAGLLMLTLRPDSSGDAGFALSFAVTAALLHLGVAAGPEAAGGWRWRALGLVRASAVATAAGMPITAYHFARVTPAAVLVNLVAVPAAVVLVGACAAATLLAAVHPLLAAPLAPVTVLAVEALFAAVAWPPLLPAGHLLVPPGRPGLVVASLAALFAARRGPGRLRRGLLAAALLGQMLIMAGCLPPAPLPPGVLSLRILDVGQGDALLVGLPAGGALLVDGGGLAGSVRDTGRDVVLPALRAAGVRRLRAVVLSHPHHDHGGGLGAVLEEMAVDELWLSSLAPGDSLTAALVDRALARGVAVRSLRRGDKLERGGALVVCLAPGQGSRPRAANDASLVLRLTAGHGHLLLAGDMEARGEADLVAAGLEPAVLLKVPHHGSRSSTTEALLTALSPEVAAISVGRANPWDHPDPGVLARLARHGATVLRTDQDGAVTIALTPGGPRWRKARDRKP